MKNARCRSIDVLSMGIAGYVDAQHRGRGKLRTNRTDLAVILRRNYREDKRTWDAKVEGKESEKGVDRYGG